MQDPVAVPSRIQLLRLHVDECDHVWYGDDYTASMNTKMGPLRYRAALCYDPAIALCVRLLGVASNAALIIQLHSEFQAQSSKVLIGSPRVCHTASRLRLPELVLQSLFHPEATSSSPGYWHRLDHFDLAAYTLVDAVKKGSCNLLLLRRHPAWDALSFLGVSDGLLNLDAVGDLLVDIRDPRWFRHRSRPGRLSNLYAYLGLTEANVNAVLMPGRQSVHPGCRNAILSWYNPVSIADYEATKVWKPDQFLWRIYETSQCLALAVLKATKKFVAFVNYIWECQLCGHLENTFQPEKFFADQAEVNAFFLCVGSRI